MGSKDSRAKAQAPRKLSFRTFCTANGEIVEMASYLSSFIASLQDFLQVLPAGLEPAACGLGIHRSIHLSYGSSSVFQSLMQYHCPLPSPRRENCGDCSA